MSDDDGFSFLDQPALAAAATPESAPHVVDEFNTLMKEARCWPVGYPATKQAVCPVQLSLPLPPHQQVTGGVRISIH